MTATDADPGATLSYTIVGGADAARFAIDATTGVLTFVAAPNFEAPTDGGGNNVYDVVVQVSDGTIRHPGDRGHGGNVNETPRSSPRMAAVRRPRLASPRTRRR